MIATTLLVSSRGFGQADEGVGYMVIDLGTLSGGTASYALALNNSNQIVGEAAPADGSYHAAFWANSQSGPYDLGPNALLQLGEAYGINSSGQIVGDMDTASADYASHATYWSKYSAAPEDLGTNYGGFVSVAYGINDSGLIVGSADDETGTNHAVFWVGGSGPPQGLATLGGIQSDAYSVNNSGGIVGDAITSGGKVHAAFWASSGSSPSDLGTLGGLVSLAYAINDSGQIAGIADNSSGVPRGAFWTNSTSAPVDLGSLNGTVSVAYRINNYGQIVGTSGISNGPVSQAAVLWTNISSPPQNLNNLIPTNSGWWLVKAAGINDEGEIVGSGEIGDQEHGFLLIPTVNVGIQSSNLTFTTEPGVIYLLQTRTNLAVGAWSTIATNVGAGGLTNIVLQYLVGTNRFSVPMRFFRIVADY